jgi:Histidine kinase-, DNA gyrase B-, and HSP90-like ATPase
MTKEVIDFSPQPHFVCSQIHTGLHWWEGSAEFIDNALDKDADKISLTFEDDSFTIEDDGQGCPDLRLMLSYGSTAGDANQLVGRYGVGLKDAAIALAKHLAIYSAHRGFSRSVEIAWDEVIKKGFTTTQTVNPLSLRFQNSHGTRISLTGLRKNKPGQEMLATKLSELFEPAIRRGVRLLLNGEALPPPSLAGI